MGSSLGTLIPASRNAEGKEVDSEMASGWGFIFRVIAAVGGLFPC